MKDTSAQILDPFAEVESAADATISAIKAAEEALKAVKAAHPPAPVKQTLSNIQFMGNVSHEMRTPLASILGYTQILREELSDQIEQHHKEFFQIILTNIELALELVTDLLDFARLDAGQLAIQSSPVAAQPLINQVIDQLYPFAQEKSITLSADLHEETSYILADEVRLRQVLLNLIINAIKYTDEGSVTVRIKPTMMNNEEAHTIEIIDTGRGITDTFKASMFERFSRDERMSQLIEKGAGIGLAVALEFIRAMNGAVEVESTLDVGTTFSITFPQALLNYFGDDSDVEDLDVDLDELPALSEEVLDEIPKEDPFEE